LNMSEHAAARHYGRLLGLLSGLFALLQVMISVTAVKSNALTIAGLQHALDSTAGGVPTNPLNLLSDLVPVLVATYLSAAIVGAIMLGFAWYAGRLTALTIGRRAFGGAAGFWVALWSGGVWLALSIVATLVAHADGTLTGILTSTPDGSRLGVELILLLLQNGFAALCGLGLGALAGLIGANGAPISAAAPFRPPQVPAYPPNYFPAYPPGYPTGYAIPPNPAPSSPAGSPTGWAPNYPPGPWYPPQQGASGAPPSGAPPGHSQDPVSLH
jgi:hypothetical protein